MSIKTCTIRVQRDATYIYYRSKMIRRINFVEYKDDALPMAIMYAKKEGFTHFKTFIVS